MPKRNLFEELKGGLEDARDYEKGKLIPIAMLKLFSFAEEDIKNGDLLDEDEVFMEIETFLNVSNRNN